MYNSLYSGFGSSTSGWLGHHRLFSTQWYAAVTPETLTQAYVDALYFERNVVVVQVLLDRAAIESGAAARGEPYKYAPFGARLLLQPLLVIMSAPDEDHCSSESAVAQQRPECIFDILQQLLYPDGMPYVVGLLTNERWVSEISPCYAPCLIWVHPAI